MQKVRKMNTTRQRRKYTAEFKTKVALMALKETMTVSEISKKYDVHPNLVNLWKRTFIEKSSMIFDSSDDLKVDNQEKLIQSLYAQIGELKVANDFYKKKLY